MYRSVFKLIFIIIIKDYTIIINEAHNRCNPARTSEKIYYNIKKPVLYILREDYIYIFDKSITSSPSGFELPFIYVK
jgi:hypothetical protein